MPGRFGVGRLLRPGVPAEPQGRPAWVGTVEEALGLARVEKNQLFSVRQGLPNVFHPEFLSPGSCKTHMHLVRLLDPAAP
jgi:hypothetical protein